MANENLNVRQMLNYAKDNGFNSVMFSIKRDGKHIVAGKFFDAYFEFVEIPILGDGCIMMRELESSLGYDITFDVLDEYEFLSLVRIDFLLRRKKVPDKYAVEATED